MNFDRINQLVASMGLMKYFPSDPAIRLALVELMSELTDDEERVRWLVKRMRTLYAEWPGEHELRACFCSKFAPKDGINAYSSVYADGIPSEKSNNYIGIEGPQLKALPPGHTASADPEMEAMVQDLAAAMPVMPKARPLSDSFARTLQEILTPPADRPVLPKTPQIITQADVDKAVEENRRRAAEINGSKSTADLNPQAELNPEQPGEIDREQSIRAMRRIGE